MKSWFKTFKNSQKIRVVVSGVIIFTKANEITDNALQKALEEIDRIRSAGDPAVGLCGTWFGKSVQVDLV